MATFSVKKTGMNISSWEYYVQDKKDWMRYKNTSKVEFRGVNPPILFKDKDGKEPIGSPLKNGQAVELLSNKSFIINGVIHANVRVGGIVGYLKISVIGKPYRDTTRDENIALEQLDNEIKKRNIGGRGPGITILVKDRSDKVAFTFMNCVGAKTVKGTPKTDFVIVDSSNRRLAYISHKKEGGSKAYQQYVSINGRSRDGINDHPIVKEALKKIAAVADQIENDRTRFKVKIPFTQEGMTLMNKAIYGLDYNKPYGLEHVHFIGQGVPKLKEAKASDRPKDYGIAYELEFSDDLSISGDLTHFKKSGYEPVILARYSSDRNFYVDGQKYTNIRVLIAPNDLAPRATEI